MTSLALTDLCIGTMVGIPMVLFKLYNSAADNDTFPLPTYVCEINGFGNMFFSAIGACTIALVNLNILVDIII